MPSLADAEQQYAAPVFEKEERTGSPRTGFPGLGLRHPYPLVLSATQVGSVSPSPVPQPG